MTSLAASPGRWRPLRLRYAGVLVAQLAALAGLGEAAGAQEVAVEDIHGPRVESSVGFTDVVGVRELGDGRVLLVDRLERHIYLLPSDLSTAETVGTHGQGPREYLLPGEIFALEGERTAVYDGAQARFLILDPDGRPVDVLRGPTDRRALALDATAAFYALGHPVAQRGDGEWTLVDSVAVLRSGDGSEGWDTIAFMPRDPGPDREVRAGVPAGVAAADRIPFLPSGTWAVASDGSIAIVRPQPYRVEVVGPDGSRRVGPPVPYQSIPLSEAHKEEWRERMSRPATGLIVPMTEGGGDARWGPVPWTYHQPEEWPETLPPFLSEAAWFPSGASVWVQRTTEVGDPVTLDVFDLSGSRIQEVRLRPGLRVVGFGNRSIYTVRRDALGLEYLQRNSLPELPPSSRPSEGGSPPTFPSGR